MERVFLYNPRALAFFLVVVVTSGIELCETRAYSEEEVERARFNID